MYKRTFPEPEPDGMLVSKSWGGRGNYIAECRQRRESLSALVVIKLGNKYPKYLKLVQSSTFGISH